MVCDFSIRLKDAVLLLKADFYRAAVSVVKSHRGQGRPALWSQAVRCPNGRSAQNSDEDSFLLLFPSSKLETEILLFNCAPVTLTNVPSQVSPTPTLTYQGT